MVRKILSPALIGVVVTTGVFSCEGVSVSVAEVEEEEEIMGRSSLPEIMFIRSL